MRDTDKEKRLVFLRARYDMVNVHVRLMKEVEYVMALYGKYIDNYRSLGGSWAEDEAFRTGKTEEEVRAEDHAKAEAINQAKADRLKELGL